MLVLQETCLLFSVCSASFGFKSTLYGPVKMPNFKELSCISDYQSNSCHIVHKGTTRFECSNEARLQVKLSARAVSVTGSWLTLSRVNDCT
jgi:hypothetical protein